MEQLGPLWITAIAVGAVVLIGLLALVLYKLVRRGKSRRDKSALQNQTRVEVLETTIIDEERKLVLVRCDKIEHLIMIGGPADLVVENDVKKVRPATTQPAKAVPQVPAPATAQAAANPLRMPPATAATLEAAIAAAVPKPAEPRPAARPAAEPRQPAQQPRATVVPAPPLPARTPTREPAAEPEAPPPQAAPPKVAEAQRAPTQRPPPSVDFGRRDTVAPRRPPQVQPASAAAQAPRPAESQRAQSNGAGGRFAGSGRHTARAPEEAAALPAAQVPWAEPDPIEGEIVQALRSEPQRRPEPPVRREPATAKSIVDSSATLGDLADRLEEALAREMQSIGPGAGGSSPQRADPDAAAFAFDRSAPEEPAPERPKRTSSSRDRQEKREPRPEPAKQAAPPAQEPEQRREPPPQERREEAPVISLNARRREAADPLEDEMARLLGELTGDTKTGR